MIRWLVLVLVICTLLLGSVFCSPRPTTLEKPSTAVSVKENSDKSWTTTVSPIGPGWTTTQLKLPMTEEDEGRGRNKYKKKLKKLMLPLLLAYKLKFFALIPIMVGGLMLLVGSTGLAGFFFALFAASMGLKGGYSH